MVRAAIGLASRGPGRYLPRALRQSTVVGSPFQQSGRLSRAKRLGLIVVAAGLLVPWGIAAWLRPSPLGLGTHQQFGLPPCTIRFLFGLRCPTCGMTTAWAHLIRGQIAGAVRANATGALLGGASLSAVVWLSVTALRGRWWLIAPRGEQLAWLTALFVAMALVEWLVRIWWFPGG